MLHVTLDQISNTAFLTSARKSEQIDSCNIIFLKTKKTIYIYIYNFYVFIYLLIKALQCLVVLLNTSVKDLHYYEVWEEKK